MHRKLAVGRARVGQPLVVLARRASSYGVPMHREVFPNPLIKHIPTELT